MFFINVPYILSGAMMVSGHKTRSVFERYNIVSPGDLKQAAIKQDAYLRVLEESEVEKDEYSLGTVADFGNKKGLTGSG